MPLPAMMRFTLFSLFLFSLGASFRCLAAPQGGTHAVALRSDSRRLSLSVDTVGIITAEADVSSISLDIPPPPSPTSATRGQTTASDDLSSTSVLPVGDQRQYEVSRRPSSHRPDNRPVTAFAMKRQSRMQKRDQRGVRQKPVAIGFGILGTFVGVAVLFLCGRSVHDYYRTPSRDLVEDHIDRFNLDRELVELEAERLRVTDSAESPGSPPPYCETMAKYGNPTGATSAVLYNLR